MKAKLLLITAFSAASLAAQQGESSEQTREQARQATAAASAGESSTASAQSAGAGAEAQAAATAGQGGAAGAQTGQAGQAAQLTPEQRARGEQRLQEFMTYTVVDRNEQEIGTAEAFWEDQSGRPAFVAIQTEGEAELIVLPVEMVDVNPGQKRMRLPYTAATLKEAPRFEGEQELDAEARMQIRRFASQQGVQSRQIAQGQQSQEQQAGQITERDQARIVLREEELQIGTREVPAGGVLLRKIVKTEQVTQPVELRSQRIVIERTEGTGAPAGAETGAFEERSIYIPLLKEVPIVDKDVQVKEVFSIEKQAEIEREQVTEEVREEELRIIREEGTEIDIQGQEDNPGQPPRQP